MTSELITTQHLTRKAVIYIRQSSPHQILSNQESTRIQYALRQRALELGWRDEDVEVIDADLGLSGASSTHREGFKDLIARVTLGQIGLILAFEVQRLTRNCSDWYPLLDLCGYTGCLIADRDGVYDPGTANGRLLLGLKGTISEVELHTIRARLNAGLLSKAARGELALYLPVGFVRDERGIVTKTPDLEVQARIELVFSTFERVRSATQVMVSFHRQGFSVPRRDRFGDIVWKPPTVASIRTILRNPAYAGAFVYGRTRADRTARFGARKRQRSLPISEWRVVVKDKYPAYITWDAFERHQSRLDENHAEYENRKTQGVARSGKSVLHGLVCCGECGHKMVVRYKGGVRYVCNFARLQHGEPICQSIQGEAIDRCVSEAFLEALSPAELAVLERAMTARDQDHEATNRARQQQLERVHYEAALAERRFRRVDPDNRLVAAELEQRWEDALRAVQRAEADLQVRVASVRTADLSEALRAAFRTISQELPRVWRDGGFDQARKKTLLRCLVERVVIHRVAPDTVRTRIVWRGGDVSEFDVPVRVGTFKSLSGAAQMEARILELFRRGHNDHEIAEALTRDGHRSPRADRGLWSTVRNVRLKHALMLDRSQSHVRRVPGCLTLPVVARRLGCPVNWLYHQVHKGSVRLERDARTGLILFPDAPSTLAMLAELLAGQRDEVRFS